ncbi:MAG: lysophospholipase [Treponema sp.]|jgi:alpha-beta hydrolase superfamily lysophospholipase|nr:lysophospholipase [Treponema sp.]
MAESSKDGEAPAGASGEAVDAVLEETWFPVGDGTKLFLRRWFPQEPQSPPPAGGKSGNRGTLRGIVHIVHGMAEHALRYERLARRLCAQGIAVWAADQRGHGRTADPLVNDPGKGGLLGHCRDRDGIAHIIDDINRITLQIRETHPQTPLFLLGHSWGSFLVQSYIEQHNPGLAGCVLSGTRGPGGIKILLGVPFMTLIAAARGCRRGSALACLMANGPYNKPFKPKRTAYDWLSRDEREVDAFIADPRCGQLSSSGFYRDMLGMLNRIHTGKALAAIPRDLPVYVFSGSADPVGEMGSSPTALVNALKSLPVTDLEFVLYPGARHEVLNETNREEVMGDLIAWINKHCAAPGKR